MKAKFALLLLVVGFLLVVAGALLKIMHWPGADVTLLAGLAGAAAGAVAFLLKLLARPKAQEFLDS
jgi:ABC-type Fe3+-siderophore transport system permease subunit